jgi:monoamine oxidase
VSSARTIEGGRALLTVPLGVLQQPAEAPGAIGFEPKLGAKAKAIEGLAMGDVVRLTLQFHSRFWPVENFGFIHAEEAALPTWWSDKRGLLLTGWVGGPKATRLSREGPEAILTSALHALSSLFHTEPERLKDLLVASFTHDWLADPFARGAYSYTPVRMGEMPARLGAPVADTLFFAGEATDTKGEQGTVHGAIASGQRAANEILQNALRKAAPQPAMVRSEAA